MHSCCMKLSRAFCLQRKREILGEASASSRELDKTLYQMEDNRTGLADLAGSSSPAPMQPMLSEDYAFALDSPPDLLPPSLSISDWNPSALGFSLIASPISAAHPPNPLAQDASAGVDNSNGSDSLVEATPPMAQDSTSQPFPTSPFVGRTWQPGGSQKGRRPVQSPAASIVASMHGQHALQHAPGPAPRVKGEWHSPAGTPAHPITCAWQRQPPHAGSPSRRHHPVHRSHPHRTSSPEGFDPFATADAGKRMTNLVKGGLAQEVRRMDTPSPPLGLSLQQQPTARTLLQAPDWYPLLPGSSSSSREALVPAPEAGGWNPLAPEEGATGRRFPRSTCTPPNGHGSRVISRGITADATAAHEEMMGLPLVCSRRTQFTSAPIVRQAPAILQPKPNNPHRGASSGHSGGANRHLSPNPPARVHETQYHSAGSLIMRTPTPMGMWLQDTSGGVLRGGVGNRESNAQDPTDPPGEQYLAPTAFTLQESSSLSWGTVEAIAAGYVLAMDGDA